MCVCVCVCVCFGFAFALVLYFVFASCLALLLFVPCFVSFLTLHYYCSLQLLLFALTIIVRCLLWLLLLVACFGYCLLWLLLFATCLDCYYSLFALVVFAHLGYYCLMFALGTTSCCSNCVVVVHCLPCVVIVRYLPYVVTTHSSHCIVTAPH
jgi:hypothetical protein